MDWPANMIFMFCLPEVLTLIPNSLLDHGVISNPHICNELAQHIPQNTPVLRPHLSASSAGTWLGLTQPLRVKLKYIPKAL